MLELIFVVCAMVGCGVIGLGIASIITELFNLNRSVKRSQATYRRGRNG
jgi:hypothetical protein